VGLPSLLPKALRGYLDKEHRDKKKKPFDFTGWEDWVDEVRFSYRTGGPISSIHLRAHHNKRTATTAAFSRVNSCELYPWERRKILDSLRRICHTCGGK
jgi:hypothetical protein